MDKLDIESLIYKESDNPAPVKGDILVAEPMLAEPYFKRSVVLLLDDAPDGGNLGLTLNIATPVTLQDLFPNWDNGKHIRIFSGGPVETDRLFVLHTLGDRFSGAVEVARGIYVGGNLDEIVDYVNSGEDAEGKIRFFLGYSGWSKNQLTKEILENSWAVNSWPASDEMLIGQGNAYWRREVERLGDKYRSWLLIPQNPEFN